jgi:hypothetical protein
LRPSCSRQDFILCCRPGLWVLLLAILLPKLLCLAQVTQKVTTLSKSASAPLSEDDSYVGSQTCGGCHAEIYRNYIRTAMGRSISNVTPSLFESLKLPATYYDPRLNRSYAVFVRNGELYQSESAVDASGKELFHEEHQLQWIVGSGANVVGAIVKREDYLFEAPLALYTKTSAWGLSPGYEFADLGFSRPILAGCMFCHSGRSKPISNTNGRFDSVVFSEMAIGCENCHGPGAAHLQAIAKGANHNEEDLAIVNPARLTPRMANDICMACHEIGDERVLKPGKEYRDIRPGKPLDDVLSILIVPPTRDSPPQADHLQHPYSMMLSKCYRGTNGGLRCINCHDPHVEPSGQEAPAYFDKKCLACHTEQTCKLPLKTRQLGDPPDDCIGCHMPKRKIGFIQHSTLTNHRIVSRPDEPFPDVAFLPVTSSPLDLIHLDRDPGHTDISPPLLTLLQAYGELAAYRPEYAQPYLETLDLLEQTEPNDALVQAAIGRRWLRAGRPQEAIEHLQRSLALGPPRAVVYSDLSEAFDKLGESQPALAMLQKAIPLDPFNPLLNRSLVFFLIKLKEYSAAQAAMDRYLQIFPQDLFMRRKFALATEGVPGK